MYKKFLIREYNESTFYNCFNNTSIDNCGRPSLNLPPITIGDSSRLDKISLYTPDLLPSAIFVSSKNYVSTLTTPSDSPQVLLLPSSYPYPRHAMKKYNTYRVIFKRGYFSRKHSEKRFYKNLFLLVHLL